MKKILVVDDDHEVLTSITSLLKEAGYYACGVMSGKAAIEKAACEKFDIALVDIIMPWIHGLDTLAELKKLSPKMQVIMITAFPEIGGALTAAKKGACDYIIKPCKSNELFSKIRNAIEKINAANTI